MSTTRRRRSYEAGHKPKWLVVIDDTPECDRAVYFAARRAARVGAGVIMLRVIETHDRNQQWLGVADIMKAEAHEEANAALDKYATRANGMAGITPERVVREGATADEILGLIEDDEDIAILVLAAGNRQGRAGAAGRQRRQHRRRLPDPGRHRAGAPERRRARRDDLTAPRSGAYGDDVKTARNGLGRAVVDPGPPTPLICYGDLSRAGLEPAPAKETTDVHPDRSHAQSGDPEVPARDRRCSKPARSTCASPPTRRNRRWRSGCSPSRASTACSSAPTSSPSPRPTASGSSSSPRSSAPSWSTSCPARRCSRRARPAATTTRTSSSRPADEEIVTTIKDLIETRVRPAVANDGGDITFRGFKEGIVYLHMKGACSGCPSSTATLQHGIQNLLKHFVPDVVEVRPV